MIKISPRMEFQMRTKTETHCTSYVVDVTTDRTGKLENGCQFSAGGRMVKLYL